MMMMMVMMMNNIKGMVNNVTTEKKEKTAFNQTTFWTLEQDNRCRQNTGHCHFA